MNTIDFNKALNQISNVSLKVIDANISIEEYCSISLSLNNKDLLKFDNSSSKDWENYLESFFAKNKVNVAFGGYLEKRNIYDRSDYFKNEAKHNQRNIHLGIDLWCYKNTKVLAVLDGEIHSFKNNNNYGDYGPTIILKHQINNLIFYTLYGHLSKSSLENINVGNKVNKGETIGFLGDATVNGDYAPHLHFQIIKDLEGNFGDYPGVSSQENINFYKNNCPDPNLLLKLNSI